MAETVFKKVDYTLKDLVGYIQIGEIGLPDIQRPFVWKNAKVRDLFDSMYLGYPVGYLLFWQNALTEDAKAIGEENKQNFVNVLRTRVSRSSFSNSRCMLRVHHN
jgi:uncharacterized protein with ParB-like and HNH nuclease domain